MVKLIPTSNSITQTYKTEYTTWNEKKKIQEAKRQEYLNQNPDAIKDYDIERAKILLKTVDIIDKSVSLNSDHTNTTVETITSIGLGYGAILGAGLGLLIPKIRSNNIAKNTNIPASKQSKIISFGVTALSGVLGVIATYPVYAFFSNIESKIDRKKRFDTMEKEIQDSRIFAVLTPEQKIEFDRKIKNINNTTATKTPKVIIKKNIKSFKKSIHEILNYDKEQEIFRKKYEEDKSFYEETLTEKEIKDAKKDKVLLCVLTKEINTKSQSYEEKMQRIADNLITFSFALGSLFALGFERIAKKFKLKNSSLPAGMGITLMLASTFFATWAQKRASHVGRFKAKQELMENPERLIYINKRKTNTISENEIQLEEVKKSSLLEFTRNFLKDNKEYEQWKKTKSISGRDLSKAMANFPISPKRLQDARRLKTNIFKTFYKVDSNTQNYSSKIDLLREAVKYPVTLLLGATGSYLGMRHLARLRNATTANDILKYTAKYIGTISLFTAPTILINSYFAKIKKMGARISDMMTMKDLEDYRFFADYSRFKNKNNRA